MPDLKRICLQVGHWQIENINNESLRSWRSPSVLKKSTGASGERDYYWNEVMPKLRDKLINAGIQVYIAGATYSQEIYSLEYDLWISLHYDGGGTGERCMISGPSRSTKPAYLNETAFSESERFCQIWKSIYPQVVGVPNKDNFITAGMRDYYAYDYVGYDTPSVIIEHFNHTSLRGGQLKKNPDLVAEADFKAIIKFLGIPENPIVMPDVYQIVYKGEVLHEYEENPADKIDDLAGDLEKSEKANSTLVSENGTLKADLVDMNRTISETKKNLREARTARDDAKSDLMIANGKIGTYKNETDVLKKRIENLEKSDPFAAYDGLTIIFKGIKKLIGRG